METGKREALAELRSQLSQAFADQRRLAARVEEHERERDSVIAEHHRALADMETGKREALAELRSQLSQAFADQRRLASRADEHELERDRMRPSTTGPHDLETASATRWPSCAPSCRRQRLNPAVFWPRVPRSTSANGIA